jgi:hypothetical protein
LNVANDANGGATGTPVAQLIMVTVASHAPASLPPPLSSCAYAQDTVHTAMNAATKTLFRMIVFILFSPLQLFYFGDFALPMYAIIGATRSENR